MEIRDPTDKEKSQWRCKKVVECSVAELIFLRNHFKQKGGNDNSNRQFEEWQKDKAFLIKGQLRSLPLANQKWKGEMTEDELLESYGLSKLK